MPNGDIETGVIVRIALDWYDDIVAYIYNYTKNVGVGLFDVSLLVRSGPVQSGKSESPNLTQCVLYSQCSIRYSPLSLIL